MGPYSFLGVTGTICSLSANLITRMSLVNERDGARGRADRSGGFRP